MYIEYSPSFALIAPFATGGMLYKLGSVADLPGIIEFGKKLCLMQRSSLLLLSAAVGMGAISLYGGGLARHSVNGSPDGIDAFYTIVSGLAFASYVGYEFIPRTEIGGALVLAVLTVGSFVAVLASDGEPGGHRY
jgi:hypothetical protein